MYYRFSRPGFAGLRLSMCLLSIFVSGFCAGTNSQEISAPAMTPATAAGTNHPAPPVLTQSWDVNGADSAWVLRPNDEILMTVYQEDDLKSKTIIDMDGMVMLPLLGQVKIGGLSLGQATAQIQQLYNRDYLVNPQVNLIVEKFAARRFAVLGQVQKPGSFDFPQNEPVNLLEAIAISGGYTRLGAPSKVSVRRVENGSPKIYRLDADAIAKDQKKKPFEILPNDIITVGERTF